MSIIASDMPSEICPYDSESKSSSFKVKWFRTVALAGATGILDIAKHCSRASIQLVSSYTLEQSEEVLRRWVRKIAMRFLQL
jgi:hypothetical protein